MYLFFDLDGTLVDSLEDLRNATEYALKVLGYPSHNRDEYKLFVGNGVRKLIERALGSNDEELYFKARSLFDQHYEQNCLANTIPYPDLLPLVKSLHDNGHHLYVYTNKPDYLAKKICQAIYPDLFEEVRGQIDGILPKPDAKFVSELLENHEIDLKNALYIGDSNIDIFTGINAHIKTIGVTWGNRSEAELREAGAGYIVHDVQELQKVIEELAHDYR